MSAPDRLKIYFVVGEESGDILGSHLIDTFARLSSEIEPIGLGGQRMQERGMKSLFEISDLSVMGITGVLGRLPLLLHRIRQTTRDIVKTKPDIVLLIDSPDFAYRVAKRVRRKCPDLKIVKYVAPSVWAWRPGRAGKIRPYIDHILAVLPFEPPLLEELGGPPATYVGHPLAAAMPMLDPMRRKTPGRQPSLVILPGSRRSETKRMLPFLLEMLTILKARGNAFDITLPAVSKLEAEIREETTHWPYPINIVTGDEARKKAFEQADLAVAASGTVTLELALYGVPMISIYKLDVIAMAIRRLVTGWTASLPNLIADYPVVPERFNEYAHPHYVARMVERLSKQGPERLSQLEGFCVIRERLRQETPGFEVAVKKIIDIAARKADQGVSLID